MMKIERAGAVVAALILLATPAGAQSAAPSEAPSATPVPTVGPSASASPGSAPTPSAAMTTQARAEYDALRSGRIDRSHYSSQMGEAISDARVADVSKQLQALGTVVRFAYERTLPIQGHVIYVYRVTCAKPPELLEFIAWDASGKIEGLILREV
jgi:hypothetical protein